MDGPASDQLDGKVKAYHGNDQQLVREDDQPHWDLDTAQTPTGGSSEEFCAMGESLTQQRRVIEEGLRIVKICYKGRIAFILTKYLFDGTL